MVSPSARPQPRKAAATIPVRTNGRVTTRTASEPVSPRATAPSLEVCGTERSSSRVVEAMIGMIMTHSTREAVSIPEPFGATPFVNHGIPRLAIGL